MCLDCLGDYPWPNKLNVHNAFDYDSITDDRSCSVLS